MWTSTYGQYLLKETLLPYAYRWSPDSSVDIVTRLRCYDLEFEFWEGQVFIFSKTSRPALRSIQRVPGVLSPTLKWPGREADNSFLFSGGVRISGAIPTLPLYSYMASAETILLSYLCSLVTVLSITVPATRKDWNTDNVRINVIMRRVRVTTLAVEKQ